MTTLSTHPRLSGSLTRASGRCPNLSHKHEIGSTGTSADIRSDVDVRIPAGDTVLEDEEIASVEADGAINVDVDGSVEKQLLTAALVTSIVELAGTPCCGRNKKSNIDLDTTSCRLARTRSSTDGAIGCGLGIQGHSYPDTPDSENPLPVRRVPEAGIVHLPPSGLTQCVDAVHGSETGEIDSSGRDYAELSGETQQTCVEDASVSPEYLCAASAPLVLASTDGLASTSINDRISNSHSSTKSSYSDLHQFTNRQPTNPSTQCFLLKGNMKSSVLPSHQSALNPAPALVPNPLAGVQDPPFHSNTLIPDINSKKRKSWKKTGLMTPALPVLTTPGQHSLPTNGSAVHLGGQLANIAESMSSQYYQADGLTALSGSEITTQGRGRIFSIDLDPSILDFVENADPLAEKADYGTGNLSGSHEDMSSLKNPPSTMRSGIDMSAGRFPSSRDRGFSFEIFSFGISEDEPLFPFPSTKSEMHTFHGNRVRGDSIIFDPTSFREGGIHETSALLHIKQGKGSNFISTSCAPSVQDSTTSLHNRSNQNVPAAQSNRSCSLSACPAMVPECGAQRQLSSAARRESSHTKPPLHSNPQVLAKAFSNTPQQSFTDTTIHMPHGSAAAAAAVAGMSQLSTPSPCDGLSLSHTACPMELLNKGGRIGIYLPEERKARIAKFHSKRKIRIWRKRIKYDCRKKLADSRPRIKGRFVKRSDIDGESSP